MTWPLAQGHEIRDGKAGGDPARGGQRVRLAGGLDIFERPGTVAIRDCFHERWTRGRAQQVLPPKLIAIMSSPHAEIPGGDDHYGYGLELSTSRGVHWVEHGGSRAGYGSTIRMAPERKFAVIIVANRSGSGMPKLADAISEAMLPLDPKSRAGSRLAHPLDADELRRCAGVYVNGSSRVVLEADGSAVKANIDGTIGTIHARGRKVPAGRNGAGEPSKLVLVPDSNGRIEFVFINGRAFRRAD